MIPEEIFFYTLFKLRTLYLVRKFCCSRPSIIIPLLLVSSDTAKKICNSESKNLQGRGPTWRCCQPKTKFICHTLWNISDKVIHMSVKIKMSPWTRPKREIVIYRNKHLMIPVNIPESRVHQKNVNISPLTQSILYLLCPPSLLCWCDSVNKPIEINSKNLLSFWLRQELKKC